MKLPQKMPWDMASTTWASAIEPVINNPITGGLQLTNVTLLVGTNSINHRLGRKPQGYLVTGMHGAFAQIYDSPSSFPDRILVLNASAPTSVDIYVY